MRPANCALSRRGQDMGDAGEREEGAARHGRRRAGRRRSPAPRRTRRASRCAWGPVPSSCRTRPRAARRPRAATDFEKPGAFADEVVEQQRGVASRLDGGVPEEERAQQRQRDADRADHQVLPRRLERPRVPVEVEQRAARQRGRLEGDPHQAEVVRPGDEASSCRGTASGTRRRCGSAARTARGDSPRRRRSTTAKSALTRSSTSRPGGSSASHPPALGRGRIATAQIVTARCAAATTGSHSGRLRSERHAKAITAPSTGTRMPSSASAIAQSLSVASRSVLIDVNSRLMWLMMMPITKIATNRSSSTPTSTRNVVAFSRSSAEDVDAVLQHEVAEHLGQRLHARGQQENAGEHGGEGRRHHHALGRRRPAAPAAASSRGRSDPAVAMRPEHQAGLEAHERLDLAPDGQVGQRADQHARDDDPLEDQGRRARQDLLSAQPAVQERGKGAQHDALRGHRVDDRAQAARPQEEEVLEQDQDEDGRGRLPPCPTPPGGAGARSP